MQWKASRRPVGDALHALARAGEAVQHEQGRPLALESGVQAQPAPFASADGADVDEARLGGAHEPASGERRRDGSIEILQVRDVAVAVHGQRDELRRPASANDSLRAGPEVLPGADPAEARAVGPGDGAEVEAVRRAEVLLEADGLAVFGNRQQREDPAAVVVEHDDRGVQRVAACREEPAGIVQEGEVARQQHHGCLGCGRGTERARDHAVDAVGAAVAEHAQRPGPRRQEGVEVAHRHAVGDVEEGAVRKCLAELSDGAGLEERESSSASARFERGACVRRSASRKSRSARARAPCRALAEVSQQRVAEGLRVGAQHRRGQVARVVPDGIGIHQK